MITVKQKGDFSKIHRYLVSASEKVKFEDADRIGYECVKKLQEVTPKDSGLTAESWSYEVKKNRNSVTVQLNNTNIQNGMNIALLIDFGHATPNGRWIEGKQYIDPAIQSIFLQALDDKWEELKKL